MGRPKSSAKEAHRAERHAVAAASGKWQTRYDDGVPGRIINHTESMLAAGEIPSMYSISRELGISPSTLYNWVNEHREVAEAIEYHKQACLAHISMLALQRKVDSKFARYLCVAAYGLRETSELRVGNTVNADGEQEQFKLTVEVIAPDGKS
jgi:transposase-like protein